MQAGAVAEDDEAVAVSFIHADAVSKNGVGGTPR